MTSMMKSSMKIGLIVTLAALLGVGLVAMATDFVWDGAGVGQGGGTEAWVNATMWDVGLGYPDDANDNATLDDPSSTATCFSTGDLTISDLVITGISPTKMTLNLQDQTLTVNTLSLGDYAQLDVDSAGYITVWGSTSFSDRVWIIADGGVNVGPATIDSTSTILDLSGTSTMSVDTLKIDAEAANAPRALKINSGTLEIANWGGAKARVVSDNDESDRRAKLWVATGALTFPFQGKLELVGGDGFSKRVELDLDQDMTVGTSAATTISGYVSIDIADNKVFKASTLSLSGPARLTVVAGTNARLEAEDLED